MGKVPRPLLVLGLGALLLGGFGVSRSLVEQVTPYLGSHDGFVSQRRHDLELRNQMNQPEVDAQAVQRAGDALGERSWTRRGIDLPLGLVNLVLSAMLFLGGLRALAGSKWGHGAWQFAARLSVPYTLTAAVVSFVEARDAWDADAVLATHLSLQVNIPVETLADFQLIKERAFTALGAAVLLSYYIGCWIYLGRPKIKALFSDGESARS